MEAVYWVLLIACSAMATLVANINCASRIWLSAFMGFLAAYLGLIILDSQDYFISPSLYFLTLTIIFLPGPILLGYISHISTRANISGKDFILCFLPLMAVLVSPEQLGESGLWELASKKDYQNTGYVGLFNLISAMAGIQILTYVSKSFMVILRMRRDWTSYQSQTLPGSWYKMLQVLVVILLTSFTQVVSAFTHPAGDSVSIGDLGFIGLVLYFIYLAASTTYQNLKPNGEVETIILQPQEYFQQDEAVQPFSETVSTVEQNTDENLNNDIEQKIQNERLFLQDNLSLSSLADQLEMTSHKLSEILNSHFDKSFYEFINDLRVRYAAQMLIDQPDTSITDIYFAAGFTTKSTFYGYFKKTFGCPPSEYRKQHKKQSD